ncbi:MAG TPA: PAS domain-containing sensor histidine kinase [Frankiaceae bacterium]|jgi:PAS domain S-box-containing protein|nr:PAS domain-containing sensor histidine kinase [Frankiaceae bacterium]
MTAAAELLRYVQLAVFVAAAVVAAIRWLRRRGAARAWLAATFGLLALVVAASEVLPVDPVTAGDRVAQRALVVVLLMFPYFLYRFTATFERPSRALDTLVHALTAAVLLATVLVPRIPGPEEARPASFTAYLVLFMVQWTLLSGIVAVRLWRAGRGQPTVARRRMRMLSSGAAALAFALVVTVAAPSEEASALALVVHGAAIASAVLFLLGFAPPRALLRTWRARDIEALQGALVGLAQAATTEDVVEDLLPRVVELVGARAAAIHDDSGRLLGRAGTGAAEATGAELPLIPGVTQIGPDHLRVSVPGGRLELWTSPYAPYFGRDELELIRTVAGLVHVTLERTYAHAREIAARDALAEAQRIAKVGSWHLDVATDTIVASDEMYRLWGMEPQSRPMTREAFNARVHRDDLGAVDVLLRAIASGEDFTNEFRLVDDDGTVRWIHARGRAQRDERGEVAALHGTVQDVTEARRLDQMRRDFVANAAHELRTPLTTVSGMATLLATQRDRLSQTELDHAFAALGRQGQRARQLVTSLLDLSRLETGRVPVDIVVVDVREVVARALETAPPPDGVSVATDLDGTAVAADPDRLEEVVVNLLSNAYRYGGPHVRVAAAADGSGTVTLAVSDDGAGVPDEFVAELFEPFTRGGAVTGTPGSGLGLAISQRLARALGGDLTYEGDGRGARFVVRLRSAS